MNCSLTAPKDMEGRLLRPIPAPTLSEAERTQLTQCLWMLGKAMTPASTQPEALVEAIRIAMAELRYRSKSSEEQHALDIKIWANACRDFPLWAVQRAADWWSKGARDGDDLGHFLSDVRLSIGTDVLARKRLLEQLTK